MITTTLAICFWAIAMFFFGLMIRDQRRATRRYSSSSSPSPIRERMYDDLKALVDGKQMPRAQAHQTMRLVDQLTGNVIQPTGFEPETEVETPVEPKADDVCPECGSLFTMEVDYLCPACREKMDA